MRTVQIIFNIFRQKPAEEFFPLAEERNMGILARVPLASGLLSGKMSADRAFAEDDHRYFNREGEAFDRGETFSGVDFETGLEAAEELKELVPEGHTLAQFALRWILMHPAVSCAIPGGKSPSQVEDNVAAAEMPPLSGRGHAAGARDLRPVRPRRGSSPVVDESRTASGIPAPAVSQGALEGHGGARSRFPRPLRQAHLLDRDERVWDRRSRMRWLEDSLGLVHRLRSEGLPLVGYTWWPLFSLIDWAYREGEGPPEDYLWHMGMYDLEPDPGGGFIRIETPLARAFRAATERTSER